MTPQTLDSTSIQLVVRKPGVKYTPLEIQVLDAKRANPDTLLAVEVGYKYRFFGEDARIASRVLGIMCTVANNFYNASIPTPRLMVHVRRLVHAGYKVGVMRQAETAALKAVSDNRNAPFTRQLAEIFTAGTMVEEVEDLSGAGIGGDAAKYLMCAVEPPGDCRDSLVTIGIMAVQISTGEVIYDCFEDGYLRSELETRLMHLQPGEILIPPNLSGETLKVLSTYCGYTINDRESQEPTLEHAQRAGVRVAFADSSLLGHHAASQFAADFYSANDAGNVLAHVLDLPDSVVVCLALLVQYLKPFKLARALLAGGTHRGSKQYFTPFRTRSHMLLSATTLQTLGVLGGSHSSHLFGGDGSLFSIMDFTKSPFGRRLLRRWVAHPLVSRQELEERMASVVFLKEILEDVVSGIRNKLGQLVDLERGLCRIHYRQASPQELLRILRSLSSAIKLLPQEAEITEPRLIAEVLSHDVWTPGLRECIESWVSQIDYRSAKSGQKDRLFTAGHLHDRMQTHHARIAAADAELQAQSGPIGRILGTSSFEFKTISGIDYLIDVKNTKAKSVPGDWTKISSTRTNSRFHTPFLIEKLAERERLREALQSAARDAYSEFLAGISSRYEDLRQLVHSLSTVDALFSLATLAQSEGYCKPEIIGDEAGEAQVDLVDARHPVLSSGSTQYVPNSVTLGGGSDSNGSARAMILTGPNAGGKSSLIRTIALICIMAQCGSYVPAQRARLSTIDAVFTRMGANDNMLAGESTFMVEMRETAELMKQATPRSLAILDELGRGTSTHDGAAIAYAVLDHLVGKRPLTFFVTHYAHLVEEFATNRLVKACHMAFLERTHSSEPAGVAGDGRDAEGVSEVTFLFKLADGASKDSFGLNVAKMAGLPMSLLVSAKERAKWMRAEIESRWAAAYARSLKQAVAVAASSSEH
ncbi:hypothetical protein GQ54DRAFT_282541 [Martensiomyces pterosporus]|nr:hypothetical protein GQ54DRAFT_282541 [Martensiomyces pterosporus]